MEANNTATTTSGADVLIPAAEKGQNGIEDKVVGGEEGEVVVELKKLKKRKCSSSNKSETGGEIDGEVVAVMSAEDVGDSEEAGWDEGNSSSSTCDSGRTPNDSDIEEIIRSMNNRHNKFDWTTVAIRAGITTMLYPSQMTQMLMQIGYEPFPPRRSVTLLGRPCLLLPSTGTYLKYIYQVDGIRGIFRGLVPRVGQQLLFTYVFDRTRCYFRRRHYKAAVARADAREGAMEVSLIDEEGHRNMDDSELDSEGGINGFVDYFREILHDLGSKVVAVVVSYPAHVVVVRTIAQFVGREHGARNGILGEIAAIYKDFGILGFYRGIVPKIVGDTCQTLIVGALAYFVTTNAPGVEVRSLLNLSFSILVSAWTYQFSVVSTTMAVNGSCLQVGRPPIQPSYDNWIHCWRELSKQNLLNRGSSIICRYYTGPTRLVNGITEPTNMYFGPNHLPVRLSPVLPGAFKNSKLLSFAKLAFNKLVDASLPVQ